ncbi:MAG: type I polyketide synthase, partial [Pseudomonadota bacterium]
MTEHDPNATAASAQGRILQALREAREQIEALQKDRDQRVAVIGMAARMPGAESVEAFWQLLLAGAHGMRELTEDELHAAGVDPLAPPEGYVPTWSSFSDPTAFDAEFFGYSPREATVLDPQHRVFLECAWQAMDDAGLGTQAGSDRIGLYAGAALNSHLLALHGDERLREQVQPVEAVVSNVMGLMPTRASYHLDLTGPSCGVQTGCSTSLVAVHTACRALLDGDCDVALAGGVTIVEAEPAGYRYEPGGIASPDGRCRSFDAQGRGTLFGNGVGVVVLKPLAAAQADGDNILAVIAGSAINNDGADKVGLLAPSVSGQAAVIEAAWRRAGLDPASGAYIEAHGTATALGDPIEFAALEKAMGGALRARGKRCGVGSVKSNVGHLDAAAGIAGLIKTVLALQHETLPASLDFETPNPQLKLEQSPFYVVDEARPWPRGEAPRRAGVSSFGMGGTNAHVVLEEAPVREPRISDPAKDRTWHALPLSAHTPAALGTLAGQLCTYLKEHRSTPLGDLAHTLQQGRRTLPVRRLCVARSVDEAIGVLEAPPIAGMQLESDAIERGVVFMFTGQGSQYPGMARILYAREPIFRDAIDACARHLEPGLNLQELLAADLAPEILERTDHAQPALFALAWALTQLWQSRGVEAEALIGHSLGEYVAACVGGVMSLEDALATVMVRGRLMQACPPGAMLAVHAPLDQVRDLIRDEVTLAAINGPEAVVLSGPTDAIDETAAHLDSAGVACRRLATSHAFHSPLMESMLEAFREHLAGIRLQPPQIDIVSNVTGTWLSDDDATDPEYWIRQLRQTVRFAEGVDTLAELDPVFLEIGAGDVLGSLVKAQLGPEAPVVPSLPGVRQAAHAERWMTQAFGRLWLNGGKVDWRHVAADEGPDPRTVSLPPYPFQRRRFATGAPPALSAGADRPSAPASGKDPDMDHWFHVPAWERVAAVRETGSSDTCWLVFGAPEDAAALASDFEASVVRLHAADRFARREDGGYDLDPRTAGDYRRLFAALAEDGIEASQWVQLPGASMRYGPDALVALAQAMIGADAPTPGLLSVITRAGQSVTGTEHLDPDSAALAGLAQVLMQEVPDLCARTIDIDNGTACPSPSLHQELGKDFHYAARLVALRGRYRWQRAFRSLPLKREAGSALRDQGVYAIVGDLSAGLGMHYARSLRSEYDARLILVAPPELPPVNEWDHWLDEHDSMHPIGQFIGRARALGREGEDWLLSRIDLGDRAALGEALLRGTMRFGPIDGVFHADVMGDAAAALLA